MNPSKPHTKHLRWANPMASLQLGILLIAHIAAPAAAEDPISILRKEHELIRKMVQAAERTAEQMRDSGEVDVSRIHKLHDFFKNFADRCHHAKEEEELFPILRERLDDATPVELLVKQHEEGRILLSGIKKRLSDWQGEAAREDQQAVARYLYEYSQLMARHIDLENDYLWPLASAKLTEAEQGELVAAFERIEAEELGQGFHEKYHALAMEVLGKANK